VESLPVVWVSREQQAVGRLDLFRDRLTLAGSCCGVECRQELRKSEIRRVRRATASERLWGHSTIVIEPISEPAIRIMPLEFGLAVNDIIDHFRG
jgi:hypothetical protein